MDKGSQIRIGVMLRHIGDKGGVTVYTRNLLEAICQHDKVNRYFLFFPSPEHMGMYAEYPNVTEILVPSDNSLVGKIIWDQHRINRFLAEQRIDVVFNPKLSVPLFTNRKTVFTMHGLEQFAEKSMFLWYDRLYFTTAMRFYCRKADGILVMTETGKRDLQKYLHVPPEKIHIVPESYNEHCRVLTDKAELLRVKNKLSLPDRFIMFIGGIAPLKNMPGLLRAFRILKNRGFKHKLLLGGFKRWKVQEELSFIESLGVHDDIIDPGFIDEADIVALYNLSDCFILPSFYEGFGIPILEAQACGCPVVVGNRGAMTEVAGEGGALSFTPESPEELADRIATALTDQPIRRSLIQHGLENVKKYSWAKTAMQTVALFRELSGVTPK